MVTEGSGSDAIDLPTLLTAEHPQDVRALVGFIDDRAEVSALLREACRLGNDVTANLHAVPQNPADESRAQLSERSNVLSQIISALSARATELIPTN